VVGVAFVVGNELEGVDLVIDVWKFSRVSVMGDLRFDFCNDLVMDVFDGIRNEVKVIRVGSIKEIDEREVEAENGVP